MGSYSRWALIQGWVLNQINTVTAKKLIKGFLLVKYVKHILIGQVHFHYIENSQIMLLGLLSAPSAQCGLVKTHSKEQPFECELCGQGLKQKGNLKMHLLTQCVSKGVEECLKTSWRCL